MSESINRLIRISNHSDGDTILTQPANNLTVEGIAVLRLIHDDFLKSRGKSSRERRGPLGALKKADDINPYIGCTQIASLTQAVASAPRSLLVGCLVVPDMRAQASMPDRGGIDLVVFRVEQVKSCCVASECIPTAQTNVHTEGFPAVDNGRTKGDTLNSTGREEKLTQECIERSDKPRMAKGTVQTECMAPSYEFLDRGIRER
jgi:hypothetical protein